jgi:hypothetical protein
VGRHVYLRVVVSESEHYNNTIKRIDLVQSGPRHRLIENKLGVKQESVTL